MNIEDNLQELLKWRRRFIKDDIEPPEPPAVEETFFLSEMKLRFVAAWAGNLVAAARAAGYKHPRDAAYKLMKDPGVMKALQKKQESMLQESGEHLARTLPLSRADVIDRLWQLAQLDPKHTNCNITGQVKAAQALEQIFALNLDRNELLQRQLQGKSEAELEFYVVHGFLPHPEEPKPALAASAEAPQLPESTTVSASSDPLAQCGPDQDFSLGTGEANERQSPPIPEPANTTAPDARFPATSTLKRRQKPAKSML